MKRFMLIITGPTAVGKTDIALAIAHKVPSEIINADVGQMYQSLTIGTAKPDWRSLSVPHHGFDMLTEPKDYTVTAYRDYVRTMLEDIWAANKLPILVGGSLFYIQSLFFPPRSHNSQDVSEQLPENPTWEDLHAIDPVRAQAIHVHDIYRIKRALAIWYATQQQPSTFSREYEPLTDAHLVFFTRDRAELYERINTRVVQMFEQGWLDEVANLRGTSWEAFLRQKKFIGYNDILAYLDDTSGLYTREMLIQTIQKKTRNYAKRQETFWRMLEKQLGQAKNSSHEVTTETVNLTMSDYDLYINQLLAKLQSIPKVTP